MRVSYAEAVALMVQLPGKWAWVELPAAESLRDLYCTAIPVATADDLSTRCNRPIFDGSEGRTVTDDTTGGLPRVVVLSANFEDQLIKLVCADHVKVVTWALHPAVRIIPAGILRDLGSIRSQPGDSEPI